jgi:hypothetical protein
MEQKERSIFKTGNIFERIQALDYITQDIGSGLAVLQFLLFLGHPSR